METVSQLIHIEHQPSPARLQTLGVFQWPIWTKEISTFPWTYDEAETCYLLEGEVIVTPTGGQTVRLGGGDLVCFPAGMTCTWDIRQPVQKHYYFGNLGNR
ncbi:cupin domain-containing protein [Trichothermofontia sp.]